MLPLAPLMMLMTGQSDIIVHGTAYVSSVVFSRRVPDRSVAVRLAELDEQRWRVDLKIEGRWCQIEAHGPRTALVIPAGQRCEHRLDYEDVDGVVVGKVTRGSIHEDKGHWWLRIEGELRAQVRRRIRRTVFGRTFTAWVPVSAWGTGGFEGRTKS